MPEKRKKYDREFREGAVRIVEETRKPIAQVARDLGIDEGTLGNWVARAREAREGTEGCPRGTLRSSSGCGRRTPSCGWSVMSSSDPWSCGSRRRRSERGTLHRRPEDHVPGAARGRLCPARGVGVVVLQVARPGAGPGCRTTVCTRRGTGAARPSTGRSRWGSRRPVDCTARRGCTPTCSMMAGRSARRRSRTRCAVKGLVARRIRRRNGLTRQDKTAPKFPDLLNRDFTADRAERQVGRRHDRGPHRP